MIVELALAAAMGLSQVPDWTWALYEGSGHVVLANERPDTPDLKTTLECGLASGLIRVSFYDSKLAAGLATLSSGDASAAAEAAVGPDGALFAPLRTDHPVFARFAATGALTLVTGGTRESVGIPTGDLEKLHRFADLCSD